MSLKQYFVSFRHGEWEIKLEDESRGGFISEATAFRAAVDAAHLAGSMGNEAEVLVASAGREFVVKWKFGRDPYPPEQ